MRHTGGMHQAFGTVVVVVSAVGLVAALAGLALSGRTWEEFGRRHLVRDADPSRGAGSGPAGAQTAPRERDLEIEQLLEARNAFRLRRGEAPVDIQAELARLTAPRIDPELRAEIRDLVIARNHRRMRAGQPPLDIEVEIEREIAGLSGI
jgi:hypothetical protein